MTTRRSSGLIRLGAALLSTLVLASSQPALYADPGDPTATPAAGAGVKLTDATLTAGANAPRSTQRRTAGDLSGQAVQNILTETFDDPGWPGTNPVWNNFDNLRTTFDDCTKQFPNITNGGIDCDWRWGAGIQVTATTDTSFAGRKVAWAPGGGLNKRNPNDPDKGRYPPNMNSWMVYGPVASLDANNLTVNFELNINTDVNANEEGKPPKEGLFVGWSNDGNNFYGTVATGTTPGFIPRSSEAFSSLAAKGIARSTVSEVWLAIVFLSDANNDATKTGAFIDNLAITQDTSAPSQGPIVSRQYVPSAARTIVVAGGDTSGNSSPVLLNGDFEGGTLAGWTKTGEIDVSASPQAAFVAGGKGALIGRTDFKCNVDPLPPANRFAGLTQVLVVPNTGGSVRFRYRIFTEDRLDTSANPTQDPNAVGDPGDSFDVNIIDGSNTTRVFRDGNLGRDAAEDRCDNSAARKSMYDLGWKQTTVSLGAFKGKPVTLSFEMWNRKDRLFNTYVYLDDVEFLP